MIHNLYKSLPDVLQRISVKVFRSMQKACFLLSNHNIPEGSIDKATYKAYNRQRIYGPHKKLCYAPYTSMFFSREGYMSPCYATYSNKSDKWPETSIKNAWFNNEFKNIREHVAKNDLEYSCTFCKPIFLSQNFGSLLPNKYEPYSIGKSIYPRMMEFELSNTCNLECIMCDGNLSSSIRKNREKKPAFPLVYNQNFLKELEFFIPHLLMAEFTGGDPFLINIYYDIWEKIRLINPECQILITTNANTMSDRIEKMLKEYPNLHFNISIDSLNKENYEKIRVNARFNNVMQNIKRFISYCKINNNSCNLLVCPMTINSKDFQELIEFANENNICIHFHTVVKPKHLSFKYQSSEYLSNLIAFLIKYSPPSNTQKEKKNAENYANLIKLIKTWHLESLKKENIIVKNITTDVFLNDMQKKLSVLSFSRLEKILLEFKNHPNITIILEALSKINYQELEEILQNESDETINIKASEILKL